MNKYEVAVVKNLEIVATELKRLADMLLLIQQTLEPQLKKIQEGLTKEDDLK